MTASGRVVALVALALTLVACGGGQVLPGVDFDPGKLPLNAYLSCTFDEPVEAGVDLRCSGTFSDPVCETSAGVGATCSAGVGTTVPIVGAVGGTLYVEGAGETGEPWTAEVKACAVAGPFQRCAVATTPQDVSEAEPDP